MATTCRAHSTNVWSLRIPATLYSCETLLERLAQELEDIAAALGPCIQEEQAMVGQRHVTRHQDLAPTDQPRIRDGVVGRATRVGRDQRRAEAGEARDAVNTRGLTGLRFLRDE